MKLRLFTYVSKSPKSFQTSVIICLEYSATLIWKSQKSGTRSRSRITLITLHSCYLRRVFCVTRDAAKNRFCENRTTKSLWIRVSPLRGMSLFGISVVCHIFAETCHSLLSGTCPYEFPHIPQTLHWPSSSASSMLYSICVKLPVERRTVSL